MAIEVFTFPTPNNFKVLSALEALNLEYKIHKVDITKGEQHQKQFKSVNPCEVTPAIKDGDLNLAESANILEYLVSKYDKEQKLSYPESSDLYWKLKQFLYYHATGVSATQDKIFVFSMFHKDVVGAVEALQGSVKNYYNKLEEFLAKNGTGYFIGDKLTIADIIAYPHAAIADHHGVDLETLPNLKAWKEKLSQESFIKKAYANFA